MRTWISLAAWAFLLTATTDLPASEPPNLIDNGGFEAGISLNWRQGWGKSSEERTTVADGAASLKMITDPRYGLSTFSTGICLKPGTYELSGMAYIPPGQNAQPKARLYITLPYSWAPIVIHEIGDTGRWVRLSMKYVHEKPGPIRIMLCAHEKAPQHGGVTYWDSVALTTRNGGCYMPDVELPVYRDHANRVIEGLSVRVADDNNVLIGPGRCLVGGNEVCVQRPAQVRIDGATVVRVTDAPYVLTDEPPRRWQSKTKLKEESGEQLRPDVYIPGSAVVTSGPGDSPKFEAGRDYLIDEVWAALSRKPDGRIEKGQKVYVDYAYGLARIDSIQVAPDGTVSVCKGKPDAVCPHPPQPESGKLVIANVYLPARAASVTAENIYPITQGDWKLDVSEEMPSRLAKTRAKLESGEPLRIVFWGDSVTVGGDALVPATRFADSFVTALRNRFPRANISMHNAGIGGSNTRQRLPAIDKEVIAHKPDLVVIEFVNDMGFPRDLILSNYHEAIGKIRAVGGEIILLTPHFTRPEMMGFKSLKDKDARPACASLREVADREKIALADAAALWDQLAPRGIPYMTLLRNRINHPDDRGHRIFVDALMALF